MIKFSVIIPVYGVEKFLDAALDGLCQQTYRDFEVILVDDCSRDQSGQIADARKKDFEEKGIAYQVIHKEINEGVGMARNTGIQKASGEYLLFLDSDDLFDPRLLEKVSEAIEENHSDVVVWSYTEDYYRADGTISYQVEKSYEARALDKQDMESFARAINDMEQSTMFGYVWNKAYRRSLIEEHEITFSTITHVEDILFNIDYFKVANTVSVLPDLLYFYRNSGQERLTGKYLPRYFELQKTRFLAFLDMQCEFAGMEPGISNYPSLAPTILETMAGAYFRAFQSFLAREISHGSSKGDIYEQAKQEFETEFFLLMRDRLSKEGKLARILYTPLAKGKIASAYRRSAFIAFVQRSFPGLFAKLKQHR